jgi:hypothetical protein
MTRKIYPSSQDQPRRRDVPLSLFQVCERVDAIRKRKAEVDQTKRTKESRWVKRNAIARRRCAVEAALSLRR